MGLSLIRPLALYGRSTVWNDWLEQLQWASNRWLAKWSISAGAVPYGGRATKRIDLPCFIVRQRQPAAHWRGLCLCTLLVGSVSAFVMITIYRCRITRPLASTPILIDFPYIPIHRLLIITFLLYFWLFQTTHYSGSSSWLAQTTATTAKHKCTSP